MPHLVGSVLDIGCSANPIAVLIDPQSYIGFDINDTAVTAARQRFPEHRFCSRLPTDETFDTVIAVAVIEHLDDPAADLAAWKSVLKPDGRIVLTTPHPWSRWFHDTGATLGLFSRHASEDHNDFIDRKKMADIACQAGMRMLSHRRFLFGVNQLFVLESVH